MGRDSTEQINMAKITYLLISAIFLVILVTVQGKICWKSCSDDPGMIQSFNIDGCRRRRGQPGRGQPKFRCDGNKGPPCTVKRGDRVYLDVDFGSDFPMRNMKQEAFWLTSLGFQLPWVGLDKTGCTYMKNNCTAATVGPNEVQPFSYPIQIMNAYPVGKYNLKWTFTERHENGTQSQIGCTYFTIRIL